MSNRVILVDEADHPAGTAEKLKAHREGLLHRAFSVFLFDASGRLLLHRRAESKYHSGGLWTNTCCSHADESTALNDSARRRLIEEMGIDADIEKIGVFRYRAQCGDLVENEIDHLFIGFSDEEPKPDPKEVEGWKRCSLDEISSEIGAHPEKFTVWFRLIFREYENVLKEYTEYSPGRATERGKNNYRQTRIKETFIPK
jgi:isopentenyl-diphosphate delta-isomerase